MTLKTLFAASIVALLPVFATAECVGEHSEASMSCVEGTQWDETTSTCVAPVTG